MWWTFFNQSFTAAPPDLVCGRQPDLLSSYRTFHDSLVLRHSGPKPLYIFVNVTASLRTDALLRNFPPFTVVVMEILGAVLCPQLMQVVYLCFIYFCINDFLMSSLDLRHTRALYSMTHSGQTLGATEPTPFFQFLSHESNLDDFFQLWHQR